MRLLKKLFLKFCGSKKERFGHDARAFCTKFEGNIGVAQMKKKCGILSMFLQTVITVYKEKDFSRIFISFSYNLKKKKFHDIFIIRIIF